MNQNFDAGSNADPVEDLLYWSKMGSWTIHEATVISLGYNPEIITKKRLNLHRVAIGKQNKESPYNQNKKIILRALQSNQLKYWATLSQNEYNIYPLSFVHWAEQFEIKIPKELIEAVLRYHKERDFKSLY